MKDINTKDMNIPVIEVFKSIQGEGMYTGTPSIFIRVSGCNLRCQFKNSICDTPYSSFEPEKSKYDIEYIRNFIEENDHINHLVITGGEPMLYREYLPDFIESINGIDKIITIETNGTIVPISMDDLDERGWYIDLYSVSPKLSTSLCGYEGELRKRYDNLRLRSIESYTKLKEKWNVDPHILPFIQFKFVYSGEDSLKEILDLKEVYDIPECQIYLMPEGSNNEELNKVRMECVEKCIEYGFNYCEREHIVIWGSKRGV